MFILIVGGGLGGLTTALALAHRGYTTRVLEGAAQFGAIGYGIQFGPNVFHALDRIGVSVAVLEKADEPPAVLMIDAFNGKEVTRVATGIPEFCARFKYPYIIIHRIDLHNVLLDACRRDPKITLVGDAMMAGFDEGIAGVTVKTEDGRSFEIKSLRAARDYFVVKLSGVADRRAAERLTNLKLYVPRERLPEPSQINEFYHADLIGLAVFNKSGEQLGTVLAVRNFGAGDLIEVRLSSGGKTELVPFNERNVPSVDVAAGRIVIEPSPVAGDEE